MSKNKHQQQNGQKMSDQTVDENQTAQQPPVGEVAEQNKEPVTPVDQPPVQQAAMVAIPEPVAPVIWAAAEELPVFVEPKSKFSPMGQAFLDDLEVYIKMMGPTRPTSQAEAVAQQHSLFRLLTGIVNNTEDFYTVFAQALKRMADEVDGAFSPLAVFRYLDQLKMSNDSRMAFRNLINLVTKTAPPKSREAVLRQIDVPGTVNVKIFTEAGRQRLLTFYNV